MNPEELSRLRQGTYRLIGAGFSYPTAEMINAARGAMQVLEGLGVFELAFAPELAVASAEVGAADLEELEEAYVALFEAGVGGSACPPYETSFRANARTGEVAELHSTLKRSYLRFGLDLKGSFRDEVDHVATEMNVMAALCRRESLQRASGSSVRRSVGNQLEFLDEHVLQWIPQFARLVETRDRHAAYSNLAKASRAFLAHEKQLVPLLVEEAPRL